MISRTLVETQQEFNYSLCIVTNMQRLRNERILRLKKQHLLVIDNWHVMNKTMNNKHVRICWLFLQSETFCSKSNHNMEGHLLFKLIFIIVFLVAAGVLSTAIYFLTRTSKEKASSYIRLL